MQSNYVLSILSKQPRGAGGRGGGGGRAAAGGREGVVVWFLFCVGCVVCFGCFLFVLNSATQNFSV